MQTFFPDSDIGSLGIIIIGVVIAQLLMILFRDFTSRLATKSEAGRQKANGFGFGAVFIFLGFFMIWIERQIAISLSISRLDVFLMGMLMIALGITIIFFVKKK